MLALLPCPAHFRSSAFSVIGLLLVMIGIFLIGIVRAGLSAKDNSNENSITQPRIITRS
jgi:hypothetical protein